ncbi:MAG: hypothetical protein ACRCZP_14470 [Phycicoccus sp.]
MPVDLGDTVPLTVTVRSAAGTPVNAATIALTIELPDGATISPTVANPPASPGLYTYDHTTTMEGLHHVRWQATTPAAAYTDVISVRPARPGYLMSLAEAREHLGLRDRSADEELRRHMEAVTDVVEDYLGQVLIRRSIVETHHARRDTDLYTTRAWHTLVLRRRPVLSLTSVTGPGGAPSWAAADLVADLPNGIIHTAPTTSHFDRDVTVTYVAGHRVIPAAWTQAAKVILQHLWSTQRGERGAPRPRTPMATMDPVPGVWGIGYSLPNAAIELLGERPPGGIG